MDYYFNLGDSETAKTFFDDFSQKRELAKENNDSSNNICSPFFFFLNDLSDYAYYSSQKDDELYEPNRQKMENDRRTSWAPQGNVDKEFTFWELYHQFRQKQNESGNELNKLADGLCEIIKDPVFQQFEYALPILKLGMYFYENRKYQEAAFCADLSGDIMSFYSDPDTPENFFPVLLKAAVLMDSGNSEGAKAEVQNLISYGILQRMGRLMLMSGNDDISILSAWPFGNLDPNMNSTTLSLIKIAEKIPDSVLEEKIDSYQHTTNPVPLVIKLAYQYEKSGQYTQALLLFQFVEQFFQDNPGGMATLKKKINMLGEKREM